MAYKPADKWDRNSFWTDGSGFEFDLEPDNVLISGGTSSDRGVTYEGQSNYELTGFLPEVKEGQYNVWSNWLDKFTIDYRFIQVSDRNSDTILFPNVDDPWMFTEYIFQGVGQHDVIVTPPLFDPDSLEQINTVQSKQISLKGWQGAGYTSLTPEQKALLTNNYPTGMEGAILYRTDMNVQSVKWGQHGNIPAHTVNMTAPKAWLEPEGFLTTSIQPVVKAEIGLPVYATNDGVFYNDGREFIATGITLTASGTPVNPWEQQFSYPTPTSGGVAQTRPYAVENSALLKNGLLVVSTATNGDLIHRGCQHFKGGSGTAQCIAWKTLSSSDSAKLKVDGVKCWALGGNTTCPFNLAVVGEVEIALYQAQAANQQDYLNSTYGLNTDKQSAWGSNVMNNSTGEPIADTFVAGGFGTNAMYSNSTVTNTPITANEVRYVTTFNIVTSPSDPIQMKSGTDVSGKGTKLLRGTGRFALDTVSNAAPFPGGDTVLYGDISQINYHRWMCSVQHCQDIRYCNDTYGLSMESGYSPGVYANVGSQSGYCNYYRNADNGKAGGSVGCPYDAIPKRAYEFQSAMLLASSALYGIIDSGILQISNDAFEKQSGGATNLDDVVVGDYTFRAENDHWLLVASADLSTSFGVYCGTKSASQYIVCKFSTQANPAYDKNTNPSVPMMLLDQVFVYWKVYDDSGNELTAYTDQSGNKIAGSPWFLSLPRKYYSTLRNAMWVDNESKFIGGYHPQYKNVGNRGPEVFCTVASSVMMDATGDTGVGDPDYSGVEQPTATRGYWTDESGTWVLDGSSVGASEPIKDNEARLGTPSGSVPVPLANKTRNTAIDPSTGDRFSPFVERCTVFSNDTASVIADLFTTPPQAEDPDTGEMVKVPPSINSSYTDALPMQRDSAYCTKCNYTVSVRWTGVTCPWCGTTLITQKMIQFPRTQALGKVQVWALPGTVIHKDAYFWRNPTVVNFGHVRQLLFKLGNMNTSGGGYSSSSTSASSETFGSMPDGVAYYKTGTKLEGQTDYDSKASKWGGIIPTDQDTYFSHNALIAKNTLPTNGFSSANVDDRYIAPYSDNDGLKMVTFTQLTKLRNKLQPVQGYVLGGIGAPDYQRYRATFDDRFDFNVPKYWTKAMCKVDPQILAANDAGNDAYVQYWSGDPDYGDVRMYFPPGPCWWLSNWLIGGRVSPGTGASGSHMDAGQYGKITQSKCFFFLHGSIPMDKDVLKAWVVITPGPEATKYPLGLGWNGIIHFDHYHAFITMHEKAGNHLHGDNVGGGTADLYVISPLAEIFEDDTLPEVRGREARESTFLDTMQFVDAQGGYNLPTYLSQYAMDPKTIFTSLNYYFDNGWWGSNDPWGYISWAGYGNQIVQNMTDDRIWRTYTVAELQAITSARLADCTVYCSDGVDETNYDFKTWSYDALNVYLPDQMQNIPGYLPFRGINTMMMYQSKLNIQEPEYNDTWQHSGQILYQSSKSTAKPIARESVFLNDATETSAYFNSTQSDQAGLVPKVLDITTLVQKHYNARVSRNYTATAGMSFTDAMNKTIPVSTWTGGSTESSSSQQDRLNWNARYLLPNYGYWLTDPLTYPTMDATGNVPSVSSVGEIYPHSSNTLTIMGSANGPFTIGPTNNTFTYIVDMGSAQSATLTAGTYALADMATMLQGVLGSSLTVKAVSGMLQITSTANYLELTTNPTSCLGTLGFVEDFYMKQGSRTLNVTSYVDGFHPDTLNAVQGKTLTPNGTGKWWFSSSNSNPQSFAMDLASTPFETTRRDWRYQASSSDYTPCYCPNVNCRCNISTGGPYTVGVWATQNNTTVSGSVCPACGASLVGQPNANITSGDGITSYFYQGNFASDPFITKIVIDPYGSDSILQAYKSSYAVLIRNSNTDVWESVLDVNYDPGDGNYRWIASDGTWTSNTTPPTTVDLLSKQIRARYVKVVVTPSRSYNTYTGSGGIYSAADSSYTISGSYKDGQLMGSSLYVGVDENNLTNTLTISNNVGNKLYLPTAVQPEMVSWQVKQSLWNGGIKTFQVYGFNYLASDLTITPTCIRESYTLSSGYALSNRPTQILGVYVGQSQAGGISLTESATSIGVAWKTVTASFLGTTYKKIIGGTYYYDYINNMIVLPTKDQDGNLSGTFESNLETANIKVSFMPTVALVKYWWGMGDGVTLNISANEQGPSYQVEREAVNTIVTTMPDNGKSVMLPDSTGTITKRDIPWVCYNHEIITLPEATQELYNGKFYKPKFTGLELGKEYDNDSTFSNLFGTSCNLIAGKCSGTVTLYGAPDTILTGNIVVQAPATTSRTYNTADGSINYYERTGGFQMNGFTIGVKLNATGTRQTLAWNQPTVVVYAHDRDPTSPL